MHSDTLYDLTTDLRTLGSGRVWSLMTSLFGDLAQGDSDLIEGPVLSSIMTTLDVRPEAARVALHRLRNDGWITSTKVGRISHHSLTDKGRGESAAASPRIYSLPNEGPKHWQLVIVNNADAALKSAGFVQIQPRIFVGPNDATVPADALRFDGHAVPDWLKQELAPTSLLDDYAKLRTTLETLSTALPNAGTLSPLDIAMLRCLVVHNWRRLVLKHPVLPRALIDTSGSAHKCHVMVSNLLDRFPRPSLADLTREHAAA